MNHLAHPTATDFTADAFNPGWTVGAEHWTKAPACIVCRQPAWCRDPQGRPPHRVNCAAVADAIRSDSGRSPLARERAA